MKKDLRGKKFGLLSVKEVHSRTRNGHIRYVCECDCGGTSNVLSTHLIQGNTKSCGCLLPRGHTHVMWKGCGDISGGFWYDHVVRSANGGKGRRTPLELTVTIEEAWAIFIVQEGYCALSGLELTFPRAHKDGSYTASLDRIDSSKGYTPDNVQWVHKDVNVMKNKFDVDYFIQMCQNIAKTSIK